MSATNVATLRSFYEALNTTAEAPDVIVVTNRFIGRMRHAGLIADFSLTVVVRFRDGLIVRFVGYRERAEALTAVGWELTRGEFANASSNPPNITLLAHR